MFRLNLFLILITSPVFAQTDIVFPWMTNNANFRGTITINNLGAESADVTLVATRNDGDSESAARTIDAYGQLVLTAAEFFPQLGDGAGYAVRLTSDQDDVQAAFVISGTGSASGSSPAQANVLDAATASNDLLFSYLPIGNGFSAPVVVNMGDAPATVTYRAIQGGFLVGMAEVADLEPGRPLADVTSNLFPELSGNTYVIASSDQPLLGMAFIFNDALEPSMAAATPIAVVPDVPTPPAGEMFNVNEIQGAGFVFNQVNADMVEFNRIAEISAFYAISDALGDPDTQGLLALLPALLTEDTNLILDYTITEEVVLETGEPSGSGNVIGGVLIVESPALGSFYVCVPQVEGINCYFNFFGLGARASLCDQ
jgi:hypothetical protein